MSDEKPKRGSVALSGDAFGNRPTNWLMPMMLLSLEEEARRRLVIDRQELSDRLEDPQEGGANLGLDARRFLGFNPWDEEVRAALGRLPSDFLYP